VLIDCLLLAILGAGPLLMSGGAAAVARAGCPSCAATEQGVVPLFGEQTAAQTPNAGNVPKKLKKKKIPKETGPAPDEPVDVNAPDPGRGVRFTWKQHPSLRVGSVLRVDFQAKLQEDGRRSYDGALGLEAWELHRSRVGIQGHLFKRIEYEVERELNEKELTDKDLELGITPSSLWKDVYVNLTYVNNAQIQIGKFKIPFGLDQMTGVTQNDFAYRSLGAIYLASARDIGGMVHGRFFRRGLNYWAGIFRHDGDNARSKKIQGGDRTFAGRVSGTPFRTLTSSPLAAMEIGTAFTISALSDDSFRPNGLRGRTVMTQDTFYEPVYVKGQRRRWEADVDWTVGPASARAEITLVNDDRVDQSIANTNLTDARARSWYVSGTWVLTGEDKVRPLKAAAPFAQGGIGAVEVAARYERLWFGSVGGSEPPFRNSRAETILGAGERVLTLGVNWTLNRFARIQVNGIREHVADPERSPVLNGAAFWSRVIRLQFVL
jgi:phosphate-selective porin OprO and OprP